MKRILSVLFFCLFVFATVLHAEDSLEHILGRIPVQSGGRAKPFETFAKENVLLVTGKRNFEKTSPTILIWKWFSNPDEWSLKPLIPVSHPELKKQFSSDLANNRIAPSLILNDLTFVGEVSKLQVKEEKEKKLNVIEKKKVELFQRARLFQEIAYQRMPGFVPHPEDPQVAWVPLEAFTSEEGIAIMANAFPKDLISEVAGTLGILLDKFKTNQVAETEVSAVHFESALNQLLMSQDIYLDRGRINKELFYNKFRPFQIACILYLMSIFLGVAPNKKTNVITLAFILFLSGFIAHAFGFALRVMISGRAPVTNMYESIIWVSMGVALFSLILRFFYRSPLVTTVGAFVASFGLLIGESFPTFLDPSISPLVPVLRSNFWLTIHVLTITLGYGAFALNWGISHFLLFSMVSKKKKELVDEITQFAYRSLQIGVVLLSAGTILGGVWASYSWGRFWGWDPKETWALIAILCYLGVLHARTAGWLDNFGVGFWSSICFLSVIMAWYGVNFVLGVGLHSYGFGGGGLPYILAAILTDLLILLALAQKFKKRLAKANR